MIIGESFAFVRASPKVFCLMLRFTWGFITILDSLGSLMRVCKSIKQLNIWIEGEPAEMYNTFLNDLIRLRLWKALIIIYTQLSSTYSNFSQLLLHLVQFILLTSSREKSSGIATLHSINLDWRLEKHIGRLIVSFAFRGARLAVNLDVIYLYQLSSWSDHRRA